MENLKYFITIKIVLHPMYKFIFYFSVNIKHYKYLRYNILHSD